MAKPEQDWKQGVSEGDLSASDKINAVIRSIEEKHGKRLADRFRGSVLVYIADKTESPYCQNPDIEEEWSTVKAILDENEQVQANIQDRFHEFQAIIDRTAEIQAKNAERKRLLRERQFEWSEDKDRRSSEIVSWLRCNYPGVLKEKYFNENLSSNPYWKGFKEYAKLILDEIELSTQEALVALPEGFPKLEECFGVFSNNVDRYLTQAKAKDSIFSPEEMLGLYSLSRLFQRENNEKLEELLQIMRGERPSWHHAENRCVAKADFLPATDDDTASINSSGDWQSTQLHNVETIDLPEEKLYVSDVIDMSEIVPGMLNLICSPTGSGKTSFIEGKLKEYASNKPQDMLYLAPIKALAKAVNNRGEKTQIKLPDGKTVLTKKQTGITAMTYAAFGASIKKARDKKSFSSKDWWNTNSVICLDELSQAVHQANYDKDRNNVTMFALQEINKRIRNKSNVVIALSATPRAALDYFVFDKHTAINIIQSTRDLKGLETKSTIRYVDLNEILRIIDPNLRGLVYIKSIKQIEKAVASLRERGINAYGIWSHANQQYRMTDEQRSIADSIASEEKIPDYVQVLFINAAYETGLNIDPVKSPLDYIIVHDSNKDSMTQARGRYRGNLETLYWKASREQSTASLHKIEEEAIAPFLDTWLDKNGRNELQSALCLKDDRGRVLGWPKTVKLIEGSGYTVDKKKKSTMYYKISKS